MAVALSQGLEAAPHGVMPPRFPVFSKPTTNLRGMGVGSRVIVSEADYQAAPDRRAFLVHAADRAACQQRRRHWWTGGARWWRHTTGVTGPGGTFDYWHIHPEAMPDVEDWCGAWSSKHLAGYTGMVNFETIGSRIIEAHLRFADQWPDLYGPNWVEAVVRLYATGQWEYRRHKPLGWLQRRPVRAAWTAVSPSPC